MKAILRKDGCLAAISERPVDFTDDNKWIEMDGNAMANFHLALADEATSLHNKIFLKRKLYTLRMPESTSVTEHLNTLNTLFSHLTSLGCKIGEQEHAELLLQSLPDSYDQLIINLINNNVTSLVFDDVAAAVLQEENRCKNKEDIQVNLQQAEALATMRGRSTECGQSSSHKHGGSKSRSKKNLKCYNCGKKGHLKKDCWSLNKNSNPQGNTANTSDDGDALCCEALTTVKGRKRYADIWLIDSGATYHMTSRREWFHHYEPVSGGSVYSCNDYALEIIGVGTIKLKMYDGIIKVVRDVRHVKGLKKNLLSYRFLDNNASEKIATNLYMLKGETLLEAEASIASCSSDSSMLWHQKLGHLSEQGMKVLVEQKLLPGLTNVSLPLCEHCITSKQHRLKFNTSNSRGKSVLELVHSNVWQAPVTSLGGAKYFVSFIDDYSRRCWVYPIKKKSDVFSTFKNFKARVELDSGNNIKCFRTDNGEEYTSEEFDDFCRKKGIKRQFTVANTPQQNGVAERMNITLLERTRAMLRDVGLEKSFWAEAVNTACYLVNRAPSTAIELETPMETWTGKPTDYSNLHVFGSIVYVMYNSQEISKLDPKSRKFKFLGYADGVKGYRFWDPTARKVIISRDEVEEGDSSEAEPIHDEQEPESSEAPTTRQSDQDGEPSTYEEAINSSDASLWMMAMQEEIEAIHKNNTWDLVPLPQGMKPIGNKWVFKIKRNGDDQVERHREKLVVKGYAQKEDIDFNEIFSPVVQLTTVRVVLAMCATLNLHLEQLDVKTSFLHGNLEEEIYMLQPEGFEKKRKEELGLQVEQISVRSKAGAERSGDNDFVILLLYVDDMLVAGPNKYHIEELKAQLAREFEMKDLGSANKILGMQIHRDRSNRKIWLSQKNYLKKILSRFNMQDCKPISTPLPINFKLSSSMSPSSEEERMEMSRVPYASAVGNLMFAMICTRPDIAQTMGVILTMQGIWIKENLLQDMCSKLMVELQSALHLARNPTFHSRTKRIRVQYHFIREKVEERTVDMQKIHTKDNIADFMTKAINADKFTWCRSSYGLSETPDLLALPTLDCDRAYAAQLSFEETVLTTQTVYFQVALLYPFSGSIYSIDVYILHPRVPQSLRCAASLGREDDLSRICSKSVPLNGGYADAQLDERCAAMMAQPVKRLLKLLDPSLIRIDEYLLKPSAQSGDFENNMKGLPSVAESLDSGGLYLYDDGFRFVIWFGRMLSPDIARNLLGADFAAELSKVTFSEHDNEMSIRLMRILKKLGEDDPSYYRLPYLVRQGDQPREGSLLLVNLLEDQMGGTSGYVDWITQIHRQVQQKA
ncbi:hypothetical protein F3Y22_tig00112368pilonHSYRG00011 [Hibiscus syriacus]|uniref:Uncharacterized protein n=1 Tax=Hibiscus syriacus TaxID=106335 RepID=A0A6A2X0E6_HIBSY|nr:hypothetical protein F3Y22_tig00112368pilonHSYRG00011 [Hibiscus syriacus]